MGPPAPQVAPTQSAQQRTIAAPIAPEPRTLLASQRAILKFVAGVPYHRKVRTGLATSLRAQHKERWLSAQGMAI